MIGVDVWRAWRAALRGTPLPDSERLPTGLGGTDGHPQPGLYKRREGGGYRDGKRQDVVWVPVQIMLVDADGQRANHWAADLVLQAVQGRDVDVDPRKIWQWCRSNPIDQATYKHWHEHGRWPDTSPVASAKHPPENAIQPGGSAPAAQGVSPAGMGHNSERDPDGIEALAALIQQHDVTIQDWLSGERVGQAAGDTAGNWLTDLRKVRKRVDAAFDAEKEPVLRQGQAIDEKWRPLKRMAEALCKRMDMAVAQIGQKEKARLQKLAQEEAARQQEALRVRLESEHAEKTKAIEAERARIAAERAAAEAEREAAGPPTLFDAPTKPEPEPEPILPEPPVLVVPTIVAAPVKVQFGGSAGAKIGLRKLPAQNVPYDWKLVMSHYADVPRMQELAQKLLDADAKNHRHVPGATFVDPNEIAA